MLPVRFGANCKLSGNLTANLDVLSRKLRVDLDTLNPAGPDGQRRGTPDKLHKILLEEKLGKKPAWQCAEAVPPLQQILMGEDTPFRLVLVDLLARIKALAPRSHWLSAVFDLSPEVRDAAVAALKDAPPRTIVTSCSKPALSLGRAGAARGRGRGDAQGRRLRAGAGQPSQAARSGRAADD